MDWQDKYEVVEVVPGPIYMPLVGYLDLSDKSLPIEIIKKAADAGCTYLKLKEKKTKQVGD